MNIIEQNNVHLPKIEKIFSHSYYWCIDQCEFATDISFKNCDDLNLFYKTLVENTYFTFCSEDIYSFFGRNASIIHNFSKGEIVSDLRNRYQGYRIKFKSTNNQIKMYNKGNNLRIEVLINNPKDFKILKEKEKIVEHKSIEKEKVTLNLFSIISSVEYLINVFSNKLIRENISKMK